MLFSIFGIDIAKFKRLFLQIQENEMCGKMNKIQGNACKEDASMKD